MTKRPIRGLKSTGRVSIARAKTATRAIKNASAAIVSRKASGATKSGDVHVSPSKTATGKHLVAFRTTPRSPVVKNGLTTASNSRLRSKTADGSARTTVR